MESLPGLTGLSAEEGAFADQVGVDLRVEPVGNMILVRGNLAVSIAQVCSRCLRDFVRPMELAVHLVYERRDESPAEDLEEDFELSAEDLGVIAFEGDEIDLAGAVAEQLLLALPYRPLCDEGCQGLCSRCGADLNAGPCGCEPEQKNNPFAALKNLRLD